MIYGIFDAVVAGAASAARQAKNPPEVTIQEYLNIRVDEFCEMHAIKQQDGLEASKGSEGKSYAVISNNGIKPENEMFSCFWNTSCAEQMVDQYIESLAKWLDGRKLVTWRERPHVYFLTETKINREAILDRLPQSEWFQETNTGLIAVYSSLTAY